MTDQKIISFDLGTSGNKASLYDVNGNCLDSVFESYNTDYPQVGWHEQKPEDWWQAVVESTRKLLSRNPGEKANIVCLAISGHSLGAVPVDREGRLLRSATPIWSDIRAQEEPVEFFKKVDPTYWYETTGNGFPAPCYTIFKIMWYAKHEPEMFSKVFKILGTKDYINLKLTGKFATDHSYASGSGVYDLLNWGYKNEFIQASGLSEMIFPEILPSTAVLGTILPEIADLIGLDQHVQVICGGVDNSCMALGARNTEDGRVYASLGSSAWIAVSSSKPVIDPQKKPYVFAHVIPGLYTSAVSIFSMGTSFKWVRDQIAGDLIAKAERENADVYDLMTALAAESPVGANKLLFNPSLAGGTSQDPNVHLRGAYIGLDLKHNRADLIRAAMEGIAMNLRLRLDLLRKYSAIQDEILLVGGGSKSKLYRRIFADVFNTKIMKTNIDQDAGALGAAAIAAVGSGLWKDFSKVDEVHHVEEMVTPDAGNAVRYAKLVPVFEQATEHLATISDALRDVHL